MAQDQHPEKQILDYQRSEQSPPPASRAGPIHPVGAMLVVILFFAKLPLGVILILWGAGAREPIERTVIISVGSLITAGAVAIFYWAVQRGKQ